MPESEQLRTKVRSEQAAKPESYLIRALHILSAWIRVGIRVKGRIGPRG